MKTVDDYIKEAWQALLRGDTARRDELVKQAERLMQIQRAAATFAWQKNPICAPVPVVICLPDRSDEVLQ